MNLYLPVLLGSARTGGQSSRVANFVLKKLHEIDRIQTELLDLAEYNFPIMAQRMNQTENLLTGLEEFSLKLSNADSILIVAPEYKMDI